VVDGLRRHLPDDYVQIEAEASEVCSWEAQWIPGMLQTDEYARAVLSDLDDALPDSSPELISRRVAARMARKSLLSSAMLHTVVSEAALRQQVGGAEIMHRQLSELWAATQRPNITVQVLPFTSGLHPGMDGPFTVLRFDNELDPDVIYVEGQQGGTYLESMSDTVRIHRRWDRIVEAALSSEESATMLAGLTRR
jgi:hypothetical protein